MEHGGAGVMYIAYFDEAGDDGYPNFSSDYFILTSIYMHHMEWKTNLEKLHNFRVHLKEKYNFPVKTEFHTKDFLTDKNPYRDFGITPEQRKEILFKYFDVIAWLDVKIINIVIDKNKITNDNYDILEHALSFNIQKIENDFKFRTPDNRFLIITDEGRLKKMTSISRKIQKYNYISTEITGDTLIRGDIEKLIEDPLPKKSTDSYFIQTCDVISYVLYLYSIRAYENNIDWASRVKTTLQYGDELELLRKIKDVLNLKANTSNEFGIVHCPK